MNRTLVAIVVMLAAGCDAPAGPTPSRDLRVSVVQGTVTAELFFPGDTLFFDPLHYSIAIHEGVRVQASVEIENRTADTLFVSGCPRFGLVSVRDGFAAENNCASALPQALVVPPSATITTTADLMACVGDIPADLFVQAFCFERIGDDYLAGKYYYTVSFWRPNALVSDWTESNRFTVVDPRLGAALTRAP